MATESNKLLPPEGMDISGAWKWTQITDTDTDHPRPRGIYVGTTDDYELHDGDSWILFKNLPVGQHDLRPVGIRKDAGDAAPLAGDVNFLY